MTTDKIWDNTRGLDEISARVFNLVFTATILYGLAVFGFMANAFYKVELNGLSFIGIAVVCLVATLISTMDNIVAGFLGLSVVAGGFGTLCGGLLGHYKLISVIDIAVATVVFTVVLGAIGFIYPESLESWGGVLLSCLMGLIVVQVASMVMIAFGLPVHGLRYIFDWVGLLIFGGLIVVDFNRAAQVTKTPTNAIHCGVAVFLDVLNVFLYLLDLFGSSDD